MSQMNIDIAQKWIAAFNNKKLDDLLALYDEKAIHFSPKLKTRRPETNGFVIGRSQLRDWWLDAFERLPSLEYLALSYTANESRVFIEYLRRVEGEHEMNIAEVLEIKNNKIVSSRVYHG